MKLKILYSFYLIVVGIGILLFSGRVLALPKLLLSDRGSIIKRKMMSTPLDNPQHIVDSGIRRNAHFDKILANLGSRGSGGYRSNPLNATSRIFGFFRREAGYFDIRGNIITTFKTLYGDSNAFDRTYSDTSGDTSLNNLQVEHLRYFSSSGT